ncbi:MAG: helix-turn-helix transcriptional regulator [Clostridiales bacterium]|jgi:transcriptional regulator with XRE-family HTH domain|nr:helix-turn-helix transcriptional regulator [Clostridiales bacterium]
MFNRKIFSDNLRHYRTLHKLKQSELGEAIGISLQQISSMENGVRAPSVEVLVALADYFSVSLDVLCGRSESRERLP